MIQITRNRNTLIHWGRVTHICVSKLTIIGSDNGLSPGRRQAIIWTNAGILLIGPIGTNFSEILIEILTFSFKKMRLKVSSAKRRPFCLGFNVLRCIGPLWSGMKKDPMCIPPRTLQYQLFLQIFFMLFQINYVARNKSLANMAKMPVFKITTIRKYRKVKNGDFCNSDSNCHMETKFTSKYIILRAKIRRD